MSAPTEMTPLLFCLIASAQTPESVLDRFPAAMKGLQNFEVSFEYKSRRGAAEGDLLLETRRRELFRAFAASGEDYVRSITPAGYIELERKQKVYEKFAYLGSLEPFPERISGLASTYPGFIRLNSIRAGLPKSAKLKLNSPQNISGHVCDVVEANYQGPLGQTTVQYALSSEGLVYAMHFKASSPQGVVEQNWVVHRYVKYAKLSQSQFSLTIPDGYMPFSLPDRDYPSEIDRPLNLKGWKSSVTGASWNPPSNRPVLFLLANPGNVPDDRAIKAVGAWKSSLTALGVDVEIGSTATLKSEAASLLWNPDGHSLTEMNAPFTPMIYLVNSKGVLLNLWMGLAPKSETATKTALLDAVAKLK